MPVQSANPPELVTLDQWKGLNQQVRRGSIDDQESWWNENLYAVGPGNLRSCWGPSGAVYTAPAGYTIRRIFFGFIGNDPDSRFKSPPPGRLGWMFISPTVPTGGDPTTPANQAGIVEQVDLDTKAVTRVGQIWQAISPEYWADAVVWRPRFFGRSDNAQGVGQVGGVLFGSPQGLYAWDGTNLTSPGQTAPDWLTDAAESLSPNVPMPQGLPGIYCMEVYNERLWVAGKDVISFSAPSNGANFSTIDGGGSFGYFGNKLTYTIMDLSASAGYLYVFGDSSTDVISNVQLSGQGTPVSPYTTNFSYQNIDPQVGHGFPRKVGAWGRYKVLMNGDPRNEPADNSLAFRGGIYLMYGGDAQVIGEKVTQVYITLDTSQFLPTLTPMHMFGFRVMLLNGMFTDPWGRTRSMLLAWNGGFWTVMSQGLNLTHIGSYEQDSVITPYGTDGTSLYRLFAKPDPALIKRLSTRALRGTGIAQITIKNWKRIFLELHDMFGGGVSLTGKITTAGGGVPAGSQDIGFQMLPGERYSITPQAINGAGISAAIDLESYSPDFVIERLHIAGEERTLWGA